MNDRIKKVTSQTNTPITFQLPAKFFSGINQEASNTLKNFESRVARQEKILAEESKLHPARSNPKLNHVKNNFTRNRLDQLESLKYSWVNIRDKFYAKFEKRGVFGFTESFRLRGMDNQGGYHSFEVNLIYKIDNSQAQNEFQEQLSWLLDHLKSADLNKKSVEDQFDIAVEGNPKAQNLTLSLLGKKSELE